MAPIVRYDTPLGASAQHHAANPAPGYSIGEGEVFAWLREIARNLQGEGDTDYTEPGGVFYRLHVATVDEGALGAPAPGFTETPDTCTVVLASSATAAAELTAAVARRYRTVCRYDTIFQALFEARWPSLEFDTAFAQAFGPAGVRAGADDDVRCFIAGMWPVWSHTALVAATDLTFNKASQKPWWGFHWTHQGAAEAYVEPGFLLSSNRPVAPAALPVEWGDDKQPFASYPENLDLGRCRFGLGLLGQTLFDRDTGESLFALEHLWYDNGWHLRGHDVHGTPSSTAVAALDGAAAVRVGRRQLPARIILASGFFWQGSDYRLAHGVDYFDPAANRRTTAAVMLDDAMNAGGAAACSDRWLFMIGNKRKETGDVTGGLKHLVRLGHLEYEPPQLLGTAYDVAVENQAAARLDGENFVVAGGAKVGGTEADWYRKIQRLQGCVLVDTQAVLTAPLYNAEATHTATRPVFTGMAVGVTVHDGTFQLNPADYTVTALTTTLSAARGGHSLAFNGNHVYAFGGFTMASAVATVDQFAPDMSSRLSVAALTTARWDTCAVPVGTKIYLAGGLGDAGLSYAKIDCWNPLAQTAETVGVALLGQPRGEITGGALAAISFPW